MPFRPTLRRNGKHMVTVQVRHDLNGEQIVQIVAAAILDADASREPLRVAKSNLDDLVRDFLARKGEDGLDWLFEHYLRSDWESALPAARLQVERLYPELFGKRSSRA